MRAANPPGNDNSTYVVRDGIARDSAGLSNFAIPENQGLPLRLCQSLANPIPKCPQPSFSDYRSKIIEERCRLIIKKASYVLIPACA
jgi:hypothetical protein